MQDAPPVSKQKLLEYLALEALGGDKLSEDDLVFLGRATVTDEIVWVWRFSDKYGTTCYVTAEPYLESYVLGYSDRKPSGI